MREGCSNGEGGERRVGVMDVGGGGGEQDKLDNTPWGGH